LDVLAGSIVESSPAPLYEIHNRLTTVNLQASSQAPKRSVPKADSCPVNPGTTGTILQVYRGQGTGIITPAIRLAAILLATMFQKLSTLDTYHEGGWLLKNLLRSSKIRRCPTERPRDETRLQYRG